MIRTALRTISLRRLAAIDIAFLGYKLIFAEYVLGVFLSTALGLFVVFRSHSFWQVALGVYLICLGIDYVPMLAYAVAIGSKQRAQAEIAEELADRRRAMSRYRRASLLLLVPLLVPALALRRERRESHETRQSSK